MDREREMLENIEKQVGNTKMGGYKRRSIKRMIKEVPSEQRYLLAFFVLFLVISVFALGVVFVNRFVQERETSQALIVVNEDGSYEGQNETTASEETSNTSQTEEKQDLFTKIKDILSPYASYIFVGGIVVFAIVLILMFYTLVIKPNQQRGFV